MGKRQLGELEPAELVVAVMISDLASHPLQDIGTPLLYGLIPVLTLLCLQIILSGIMLKSVHIRSFLCGKPSIIIENGRIIQSEMRKNRLTIDELSEELRKKDILDISSVQFGIIETDGSLSAILYPQCSPVTPQQMNIRPEPSGYPMVIIDDGQLMEDNLSKLGLDRQWLKSQLLSRRVTDISQVFMMSADNCGNVYFSAKEGQK
jgi:uncharacterized membrane protein YcaP (DUF421 family)